MKEKLKFKLDAIPARFGGGFSNPRHQRPSLHAPHDWDNGRLARCEERIALTDFGYSTTPYPTNGV